MNETLHGRVAWVTGAGRGIGRAIAVALAKEGAQVLCTGRSSERLDETVALCSGRGESVVADVNVIADLDRCAAEANRRFGQLDILVNNAGISGDTPIFGPDGGPIAEILATNLIAPFHATRAAAPFLPTNGHGRVVNLSSVLGRFGVPGYAAYCASKHGIIGLTRATALELAPHKITVNAVCPGWVDTEMAQSGLRGLAGAMGVSFDEARRAASKMAPLDVILSAEEVAKLVVFLCGDAARHITGQAYNICGGQTMD